MHTISTTTTGRPDLWAACALPGDGPEFRFTPPVRSRVPNPLRSLWPLLSRRREEVR